MLLNLQNAHLNKQIVCVTWKLLWMNWIDISAETWGIRWYRRGCSDSHLHVHKIDGLLFQLPVQLAENLKGLINLNNVAHVYQTFKNWARTARFRYPRVLPGREMLNYFLLKTSRWLSNIGYFTGKCVNIHHCRYNRAGGCWNGAYLSSPLEENKKTHYKEASL